MGGSRSQGRRDRHRRMQQATTTQRDLRMRLAVTALLSTLSIGPASATSVRRHRQSFAADRIDIDQSASDRARFRAVGSRKDCRALCRRACSVGRLRRASGGQTSSGNGVSPKGAASGNALHRSRMARSRSPLQMRLIALHLCEGWIGPGDPLDAFTLVGAGPGDPSS